MLSVEQGDVNANDIAEAGDPQWRAFCPRHQCRHAYRSIDFSHGFKRDLIWEYLRVNHDDTRYIAEDGYGTW